MTINPTPLTPEQRELIRVLKVHPDVWEATVQAKDGSVFVAKYPTEGGDGRICYKVSEP